MIMDPVEIVARIDNKVAVFIGSVTFIIATMGINIVANFVSPAYDIANLFPKHIDFKTGGLITSILAVLVCPWIFVDSPQAITIFVQHLRRGAGARSSASWSPTTTWSRSEIVTTAELYTMSPKGRYYYDGGWNKVGLRALAISGVIAIGWELCTQLFKILPENNFGWVIGAAAGALIYTCNDEGSRGNSLRPRLRNRSRTRRSAGMHGPGGTAARSTPPCPATGCGATRAARRHPAPRSDARPSRHRR